MTGEVSEGKREVDIKYINTLDSYVSDPEIHVRLRTYVTSRTHEEDDPSYDLIICRFFEQALVLQRVKRCKIPQLLHSFHLRFYILISAFN